MRWFVEITSLSAGAPASRLTVEAATWQGALAQARNAQKDTAPLSNFTIEVLPDGYRATNGLARMRYVVSRAPDDAPLFNGEKAPSVPPPDSKSPAAVAANVLGRRLASSKMAPIAPPAAAPVPVAAPAPTPASVVERGKIILRKAEEPGARSPLSYRELAIAIVAGTPVPHALAIARANLEDVKAELANAPAGKLVQLAVFDHEWSGRPQRAPLVALTWKDWRGAEPEVKYPGSSPSIPTAPVSTLPSGREPVDAKNIASEISSAVAAARPAPVSPSQPQIPAAIESIVSGTLPAAARPPSGTMPAVQATKAPSVPPPAAKAPSVPPPAAKAPSVPPPAAPSVPPPAAKAPSVPPPAAPSVPQMRASEPPISMPRSSRPDDLVSELFESMHDVHFMRDALDGADFVLELLREKIPTKVALVHFFDINTKEFVVVKARAPRADVISSRSKEGLLGAAVNTGKPIFIRDTGADERWQRERYLKAGHPEPRQIVIAPMRQGGRYLGAIELADHEDGEAFGDNEIHALSYVAEQFSEFVGERGILLAGDTGSFQVVDPNAVRAPRAR